MVRRDIVEHGGKASSFGYQDIEEHAFGGEAIDERSCGGRRCGRLLPSLPRLRLRQRRLLDIALQCLATDASALSDACRIDVTQRGIDGGPQGRQEAVEGAAHTFDVVEEATLLQHGYLALDYIDGIVEERLQRIGAAASHYRIRVFARRQRDDEGMDARLEQ